MFLMGNCFNVSQINLMIGVHALFSLQEEKYFVLNKFVYLERVNVCINRDKEMRCKSSESRNRSESRKSSESCKSSESHIYCSIMLKRPQCR